MGNPFCGILRYNTNLYCLKEQVECYSSVVKRSLGMLKDRVSILGMEGDLSKKFIHINESFVHAIYIGIVVNSYSDIVAYI